MTTISIVPWLSVTNAAEAVAFYRRAFGAEEVYRLEMPDGDLIARLSVAGAEFWLSSDSSITGALGGGSIRMIITVPEPVAAFARAIEAGAIEVFPVGEQHGWRLGRLIDPFGLHWEIGHQI